MRRGRGEVYTPPFFFVLFLYFVLFYSYTFISFLFYSIDGKKREKRGGMKQFSVFLSQL